MSHTDKDRCLHTYPSCGKFKCGGRHSGGIDMNYGNQFGVTKSFYNWCVENNRMDLNDRFDEEKNGCTTKEVGYKSNLQWWFKCPKNIHESELHYMTVVTNDADSQLVCNRCNSVAQIVIDKFGLDYLESHWSKENIISPWDVLAGSAKSVIIQCDKVDYHVYSQIARSFARGVGCPYCINRKVHPNDSLASVYPEVIDRWSDKNEKSPYEYSPYSEHKVWLKCPCGKHEDYEQKIANASIYDFRCPKCSCDETSSRMRGENSPFWRGGISGKNDILRQHREYKEWRAAVYKRDNYTCQCCGIRGGKLNAHHLVPFADCEELRYDVNNGITLCEKCHDSSKKGSFHNLYGTHNNTINQLREYILNKANVDLFIIHPEFLSLLSNNTKLLPPEKEET